MNQEYRSIMAIQNFILDADLRHHSSMIFLN